MSAKIAIIGSGISGLTAAYLLNRCCEITVFEKADRLGGHTATIDVEFGGEKHAIDTGFIVYNDWTYPNFIKLLTKLGVDSQATSMGFSVASKEAKFEYAGNNLNALFSQRRNLLSLDFLRMLRDIARFNRQAKEDLRQMTISREMTLGEYLEKNRYSEVFAHYYLVPMGAAIWSASLATMKEFPVYFFVQFFHNHGLLNITDRPQWRVIKGGSKQYIQPLVASFADRIVTSANIVHVRRSASGAHLTFADGREEFFDQVVFATHSDEALALLADASDDEKKILGDIPYSDNSVLLHHDESLLPVKRRAWSSWNYRLLGDQESLPIVTYNMNMLQGIESKTTFCVSLNADSYVDPSKIIGRFNYAHPQFSLKAIQAQARWADINGCNSTWFCGAYWANGFHEDGVVSAMRIAENFGEFLSK